MIFVFQGSQKRHVRVAISQKGLARIGKKLLPLNIERVKTKFHQSDVLETFLRVTCLLCDAMLYVVKARLPDGKI